MQALESFHAGLGAEFVESQSGRVIDHYGDAPAEYEALRETVGVIDLSDRGRICLTGSDRTRLLNGQVTNDVKALKTGEGCHAALVSAKGRIESDLNVYRLEQELLLDFEPGLSAGIATRLEKFIIADDVEVVDVAPHYGLLSIQGPRALELLRLISPVFGSPPPPRPRAFALLDHPAWGELYCVNMPRTQHSGFDLFIPTGSLESVASELSDAMAKLDGRFCGGRALEMHRIEEGTPRFGVDMDDSNLAPETGIGSSVISYSKGCYIGQEVIARIRTYGQVKKTFCGFLLPDGLDLLPGKGDKLFHGGHEAGYITSALRSPRFGRIIALGYARREHNEPGTELTLSPDHGSGCVRVVRLPFSETDLA